MAPQVGTLEPAGAGAGAGACDAPSIVTLTYSNIQFSRHASWPGVTDDEPAAAALSPSSPSTFDVQYRSASLRRHLDVANE